MDPQSLQDAFDALLKELRELGFSNRIDACVHRIVHGGKEFSQPVKLNDAIIARIERLCPLAPLHNPNNLRGVEVARSALPEVPHVAVFDTALHRTMPRRAKTYALRSELSDKHGVERYGFHGPSHDYVSRECALALGSNREDLRIVSLHLGNGASACALEYGASVETSMGLTPLEGLVMGTRSGDVDVGAAIHLAREEKWSLSQLDDALNKESGLKGISGIGNDLRDLEEHAAEGHDKAGLALNVFAHRAKKYIGAYTAVMGGVDVICFTGGIGENSASMRQRILGRLDFLGVHLDFDANRGCSENLNEGPVEISDSRSRVKVIVVRTHENLSMARSAASLLGASLKGEQKPIPIAVSARHVHLTQESLVKLFGENASLTPLKELSQPGQFACEEKVNLIGPRGRIDGVRILGPLRPGNQIEISRTDEFKLGVDAPVRHSGHVKASAPIVLEGPKGRIELREGLICAWRHIHMQPEDALAYGVKDKDYVEVDIIGGDRELTFKDVLVRVKDSYRLEMHIDTDEANAADLPRLSEGLLVRQGGRHAKLKSLRRQH